MTGVFILSIFAASVVVSVAISCGALWLACQGVLSQKIPLKRCVVATLVVLSLWFLVSVLSLVRYWLQAHPLFEVVGLAVIVGGAFVVFRRAFRIGWASAGAVTILYFVLHVGFQVGSAFALRATLLEAFVARGRAMDPTVIEGDRLIALKGPAPGRWDVVVYRAPGNTVFLHRVVGLPGETIRLDSAGLVVNGVRVSPPPGVPVPIAVPAAIHGIRSDASLASDEYFVVGDNAAMSGDSRYFGTQVMPGTVAGATSSWGVPRSQIVGVVGVRYWPFERFEFLD